MHPCRKCALVSCNSLEMLSAGRRLVLANTSSCAIRGAARAGLSTYKTSTGLVGLSVDVDARETLIKVSADVLASVKVHFKKQYCEILQSIAAHRSSLVDGRDLRYHTCCALKELIIREKYAERWSYNCKDLSLETKE